MQTHYNYCYNNARMLGTCNDVNSDLGFTPNSMTEAAIATQVANNHDITFASRSVRTK